MAASHQFDEAILQGLFAAHLVERPIRAHLAEAALDLPPTPTVSLKSTGVTLIYGRDEKAIDAARRLADRLECTVLLNDPGDIVPPRLTEVPIYRGMIVAARGHLGAFEIEVNRYAAAIPSSRGRLEFDVEYEAALVGTRSLVGSEAVDEDEVAAALEEREIDGGGPVGAAAVVVAVELATKVAGAAPHVEHRVEFASDGVEMHSCRLVQH